MGKCPECDDTRWFSPTNVHDDGWPCEMCKGKPAPPEPAVEDAEAFVKSYLYPSTETHYGEDSDISMIAARDAQWQARIAKPAPPEQATMDKMRGELAKADNRIAHLERQLRAFEAENVTLRMAANRVGVMSERIDDADDAYEMRGAEMDKLQARITKLEGALRVSAAMDCVCEFDDMHSKASPDCFACVARDALAEGEK